MSKRCSGFAVSTSRICRKKFTFLIQNKRYCYIHARFEFNKYARRIQKHWIGYRSRCLMKNIYNKLPDEIQRKIIFYVRENYLIKKYQHDVICRILDRKLDRVWLLSVINNFRNRDIKNLNSNLNIITHIYYLYSKYFIITSQLKKSLLYYCISDFWECDYSLMVDLDTVSNLKIYLQNFKTTKLLIRTMQINKNFNIK